MLTKSFSRTLPVVPEILPEKAPYDALLILAFGGPERPEDVLPFLENVTRGRGVPRQRLEEVAAHYHHFGGKSPLNDQVRALLEKLAAALEYDVPIYWGNRNWHPFLSNTVAEMKKNGVRRALALALSAFPSYSGCRQYIEDIQQARSAVGRDAPEIDKLSPFSSEPWFLDAVAARVRDAVGQFDATQSRPRIVFTAHSIPASMAATCRYEADLQSACREVANRLGFSSFDLVFQSRSGPPSIPWLGPDITEHLSQLGTDPTCPILLVPIGFLSDHMEVVYDLDIEASQLANGLGLRLTRATTVGTHNLFITGLARHLSTHLRKGAMTTAPYCGPSCCALKK